jgi:hypothetical protein
MKLRRRVLAAAVGVSGATAALASPAAAVIIIDTPPSVTVSPQTDVVANQTPVTVAWQGRPSGPLSVDLCDMGNTGSCVAVYSSTFEGNEGSVTRTLPGSVHGKRCSDGTANLDITCVLKVTGVYESGPAHLQVWFTAPSTK